MTFGATTIAAIYKDRWQIEIYFKTIKQNLRIKTFVGTSPNALLIQIWTALIAVLILKYLKFDRKHFGDIFDLFQDAFFSYAPDRSLFSPARGNVDEVKRCSYQHDNVKKNA